MNRDSTPSGPLTQLLRQASEAMPAVIVPPDLWRRGRRSHRRRQQAMTAILMVATIVLLTTGSWFQEEQGRSRPAAGEAGAVPARFHRLWPWQAAAVDSPPGRAAMLVSGNAGLTMGTVDLPGVSWYSVLAVVGQNGIYRTVRSSEMYRSAGQDMILSPDGRYVAAAATLEDRRGSGSAAIAVLDLTTGTVRRVSTPGAKPRNTPWSPVAWSPDGSQVLVRQDNTFDSDPRPGGGSPPADETLLLVDPRTGTSRALLDIPHRQAIQPVHFAAFSPDGRQLAAALGDQLVVVDIATGTQRGLTTLGERQRLAGTGAWSLDGQRIAVTSFEGCATACSAAKLNQRTWQLGQISARTGQPADSPGEFDPLRGAAVRLLGWQRTGHAVVVRYVDEEVAGVISGAAGPETYYKAVIDVDLLALRPRGGTSVLLDKPARQVWDIDVPQNLLREGRFGGPSPAPGVLPLPWWIEVPVAVLLALIGWRIFCRARRRRGHHCPRSDLAG